MLDTEAVPSPAQTLDKVGKKLLVKEFVGMKSQKL